MSYPVQPKAKLNFIPLLGPSALALFVFAAPVLADDFVIAASDGSTNGTLVEAIDGGDTVSLAIALTTTENSNGGRGISTTGNANRITILNNGSLVTQGSLAAGIYNDGNDNITTLTGAVATLSNDANGIYNIGDGNSTTVSGTITTKGNGSYGIVNTGNRTSTTVTGTIISENPVNASGINNNGSDNDTIISGTIITQGQSGSGVSVNGDRNATQISGTVSAAGLSAYALWSFNGVGNSFTLNPGATLVGNIHAITNSLGYSTRDNKLIVNLGQGASYAYSVGGQGVGEGFGQWTFTDANAKLQSVTIFPNDENCADVTSVCNLVTGVSMGNLEVQNELQSRSITSLIGSLRLGQASPEHTSSYSDAWASGYSGTFKRVSRASSKYAFDGDNAGLTIGTPVTLKGQDWLNMDLVFNVSNATVDIGSAKQQEVRAQAYKFGAVLHALAPATDWSVDAYGFLGHTSYKGKRKVMNNKVATGSQRVTATYSGLQGLVGADARYTQPLNEALDFTGQVQANLSHERIGSYSESQYFSWNGRNLTQVSAGLSAGMEYKKDALTSFVKLGVEHGFLIGGKSAGYNNNGAIGSFTDSASSDTQRTIAIGVDYESREGILLTGSLERASSIGGVSQNSASVGVHWTF
jgi:hypothetical protein